MAWSASGVHRETLIDLAIKRSAALDLDAASMFKVALFNNSVTPDPDASAANSAYNAGTWLVANEVSNGGWSAGGLVIANLTVTAITKGFKFDGDDTANVSAATMSNIYGCHVYADAVASPVADIGFTFHYFGGSAFSVTSGSLTLQWNASGILTMTGP